MQPIFVCVATKDLRSVLDGWEYEPGKISVRKIIGADGLVKIQTRVDLGLLQFEPSGRPDGQRPFGCESLLDYYESRLRQHVLEHGNDEDFSLSADACRNLRHEGHLYYQRYLSLFVLEDFEGVERDAARNLRVFDLCRRYGANDGDRVALEPQRAYVVMMLTRARAYHALQGRDFENALRAAEEGVRDIRTLAENRSEGDGISDCAAEMNVLRALREEILSGMPEDSVSRLRWELSRAIANEDYERAAQLRDRLASARPHETASNE